MSTQPATSDKRPATRRGGRRPGAGAKPGNLNALKTGARSKQVQALTAALKAVPLTTDLLHRMTTRGEGHVHLFAQCLRHYADLIELHAAGKRSTLEANNAVEQIRLLRKNAHSIRPSNAAPPPGSKVPGFQGSVDAPLDPRPRTTDPYPRSPLMVFDRMDERPAFVGLPAFMRVPELAGPEALRAERPDAVIVGAPTDTATTHRPGARFGPRAIRAASNLRRSAYHLGLQVQPFKLLRVFDYGDADCIPGDIERTNDAIKRKVGEVAQAGAIPIVLGGDHSITYPSASAVAGALGSSRLGILHFDAHADTANDAWGVLLSHGTPMRRLIESGAVAGRAFVQVGLRGYWPPPEVFDWMRQQGMRWHTMHDIQRRGFDAVLSEALEQALDGADRLYLSVDVDVLDPAYAPGTGTPEPGGLTPLDLLRAVRDAALRAHLAAADVVEVSPPYDNAAGITAEVAHRVVLEILSALAAKRAGA